MLQDFNTSADINAQFHNQTKHLDTSIDFSIKILCKANWPSEKNHPLKLPKDLEIWKKEFDDFYKKISSNYKMLEWVYSLSTLTIRMNLASKYDMTLSMYQAAILFLFETEKTSLTINQISEKLLFTEEFCLNLIKPMVLFHKIIF